MTLQLPKLDVPVLTADASFADNVVTTRFRGTADVEAKPGLDQYVAALHEEACRVGATKVVIDFRELEFMNSSSFKVFVTWLAQVQGWADFLVQATAATRAGVLGSISGRIAAGGSFDDWLGDTGPAFGLPGTLPALDRQWQAWQQAAAR